MPILKKAARRIVEIASTIEPIQDGRIHVEKINGPFLKEASPAEYGAGIAYAIDKGWLWKHESTLHTCQGRSVCIKRPPTEAALLS
jgi:hypothetical protein